MDVLTVDDVSFGFGGRSVLEQIRFSVGPGEFLGVLGPNGAGKSTLLRLILGLLRPNTGQVRVLGEAVEGLARRAAARRMAFVAQNEQPAFGFVVRELVAMGRTPYLGRLQPAGPADRAIVQQALAETETTALAERPVTALSGGERQRVLLARAFAQATPLLLLDEPTANLDLFHELQFFSHVRERIRTGLAVIAVLHDLNLASAYCDRLLLLNAGRIAAVGAPTEVLTAERIHTVFRVPAAVQSQSDGSLRISVVHSRG